MTNNPFVTLRTAMSDLLGKADFNYAMGETRQVVNQAQQALRKTAPAIAHEHPAGIFKYDPEVKGFVPVDEDQAMDSHGNLRPGYEYLFKQPPELVAN